MGREKRAENEKNQMTSRNARARIGRKHLRLDGQRAVIYFPSLGKYTGKEDDDFFKKLLLCLEVQNMKIIEKGSKFESV